MIAMGPADLKSGDIVLPVTGGTGRYAGAHGQLTSRSLGQRRRTRRSSASDFSSGPTLAALALAR